MTVLNPVLHCCCNFLIRRHISHFPIISIILFFSAPSRYNRSDLDGWFWDSSAGDQSRTESHLLIMLVSGSCTVRNWMAKTLPVWSTQRRLVLLQLLYFSSSICFWIFFKVFSISQGLLNRKNGGIRRQLLLIATIASSGVCNFCWIHKPLGLSGNVYK